MGNTQSYLIVSELSTYQIAFLTEWKFFSSHYYIHLEKAQGWELAQGYKEMDYIDRNTMKIYFYITIWYIYIVLLKLQTY